MTVSCFAGAIAALPMDAGQQAPAYRSKEEKLPVAVAPQPIPFSHKTHAAAKLGCRDCHGGAYKDDQAGYPATKFCISCHRTIARQNPAVQRLNDLFLNGKEVEWVRVYQVPDYVFFSHATHANANVECQTCHGPVQQREVLAKEVSTSMNGCVNCHSKRDAPTDCRSCHELGR